MASPYGNAVIKTDHFGTWITDGYASVIDGYGNVSYTPPASSVIKSFAWNGSSAGVYTITMNENWIQMLDCTIKTAVPSGLSPQYLAVQLYGTTIGQSGVSNPTISFVTNVSGTPTTPPIGSGLYFMIILKQSQV